MLFFEVMTKHQMPYLLPICIVHILEQASDLEEQFLEAVLHVHFTNGNLMEKLESV